MKAYEIEYILDKGTYQMHMFDRVEAKDLDSAKNKIVKRHKTMPRCITIITANVIGYF